jgi:DNA polymerase-3 subunit alpha
MQFCHLHVHDEYSLLDGFGTAKAYIKKAKELGHNFISLTNHGNVDGLIKFQSVCDKQGIKPILGCEAYIVPDASKKEKGEKRGHITLLVKNEIGWQNLIQMLTKANLEGMYYRPRIDFAMLRKHYEGLVILTGCSASFLNIDKDESLFQWLGTATPDDLYLEIMPHNMEAQKDINQKCLDLSKAYGFSLVATNDCHYVNAEDSKAHEVLLAIQTKAKWTDKNRYKFSIDGFHMRSAEEMSQAFRQYHGTIFTRREINDAIERTIEIAEKCSSFRIPKKEICLPKVPGLENEDEGKYLWNLAEKKLLSFGWDTEKTNQYFERLSLEWELINSKKFMPYFMVVREVTDWCHKNNIMVGPGRGSAGGSLLAFLLEITTVDPIVYGLLFSRFISEDRQDYPDIDLDFEDIKRPLIRKHLEEIYGMNNISSLSTFMKMKGRTTVRDIARVFDISLQEIDAFAKVIDEKNIEIKEDESAIEYAAKNTDEGIRFAKKYPHIIDYSVKLEGIIRGGGQHAAAVLVSGESLLEGTRCSLVTRSGQTVANWDMGDSEYVGLIKLDVLGLNTLTVLNETKRIIEQDGSRPDFEFEKIPLDDPTIYKEISDGNNVGIFQVSAYTTSKYAKIIKPQNIEELSATIALIRPGPMDSGMLDNYIKRKNNGERWQKKHPKYENVVKETYGIIAYQEQIMEIIHSAAGLSYTTADKIRKVIGKKRDVKEFKPFEEAFIEGCLKEKTLSIDEAKEFWEGLQKHANYSFNKSHAYEYAIISYWTAWCKFYYPKEFICALLTYGAETKLEDIVNEAERLGLYVKTPRIGISESIRWIIKDNELYAPFISIKGIGDKTAEQCAKIGQAKSVKKNLFFQPKEILSDRPKGKLEELLKSIGAYGEPPTGNMQELFSFPISDNKKAFVPNLMKVLKGRNILQDEISKYCSLDIAKNNIKPLIAENKFTNYKEPLMECKNCELHAECKAPVMPSPGIFNIAIMGEAPGESEDKAGKGLIGKSGVLTWTTLENHGLYREDFHVTNAGKCFPSKSKTPNKKQLLLCRSWLEEELYQLKPILILAFGNVGLSTFTDKDKGITEMSGKTTWNEEFSCWICWCIHPAAVLRNPGSKQLFNDSIKNFADKIDLLAP